eukprot:5678712-Amphidinium_carterae.1
MSNLHQTSCLSIICNPCRFDSTLHPAGKIKMQKRVRVSIRFSVVHVSGVQEFREYTDEDEHLDLNKQFKLCLAPSSCNVLVPLMICRAPSCGSACESGCPMDAATN